MLGLNAKVAIDSVAAPRSNYATTTSFKYVRLCGVSDKILRLIFGFFMLILLYQLLYLKMTLKIVMIVYLHHHPKTNHQKSILIIIIQAIIIHNGKN